MDVIRKYSIFLCCLFAPFLLFGQNVDEQLKQAEAYHNSYHFDKAIDVYSSLLESITDSIAKIDIVTKMVRSENGKNMLQFATFPKVLLTKTVPAKDFYLYYSHLQDKSWAQLPNAVVKEGQHPFYSALYFPPHFKQLYFSSVDNSNTWNIYHTACKGDSIWSLPALINENITSPEDDIFPMLSPSGKELYFSSTGLFGMGGYDIFVSKWNETTEDWDTPENLGFPFSSPYDDFLFCDTPDGKYSIFASNRDCAADSMTLYVIEFENTPVKKAVESIEKAIEIAHLFPIENEKPAAPQEENTTHSSSDSIFSQYSTLLSSLRKTQDTLQTLTAEQNKNRELYAGLTNEGDMKLIESKLLAAESRSLEVQERLSRISDTVQQMEMDFLMKGITFNLEDLSDDEQENNDQEKEEYLFTKHVFGEIAPIPFEIPKESFDYSFKILDTAVFAESNILPDHLVYQIQLFVTSRKVMLKQLKGLSPIFETRLNSGKYQYCVGLFNSYKEVLSHLNAVKKAGFRSAFIVAYNDGKSLSISKARQLESSSVSSAKYRIVLEDFDSGIPDAILALIRQNSSKDIAKSLVDGATLYIIAPFETKQEAETLYEILKGEGIDGVSIEIINK